MSRPKRVATRIPYACPRFTAFSGTQDQGEDTLVYETDHVQKLFLRTVETGLQDENVMLCQQKINVLES